MTNRTRIHDAVAAPFDLELTESFAISGGAQERALNVLVTVTLEGGAVGLGEAAPFPAFNGETQAAVLEAWPAVRDAIAGANVSNFRGISAKIHEATTSSALAFGVETAVLDALCRSFDLPLVTLFGGDLDGQLRSDVTITAGTVDHARASAQRAMASGFDTLKVKVGAGSARDDVERILAIASEAPSCRFILDANGAFEAAAAIDLLASLRDVTVALFEQPTGKDDIDGLAKVREYGSLRRIRVAADESLNDAHDLRALAGAVDVVNVKPSKSGLVGAYDLSIQALGAGFGLMIGGMVESGLAMSASACLASAIGRFDFVDLDTPLFFADAPLVGGMRYEGACIRIDRCSPGHGVRLRGN